MKIAMVVAVAANGVIGRDNDMPWRLPGDLKHFKKLTVGHAVVMGRKTFRSIGSPLPERLNIVLSRDDSFTADRVEHVTTAEAALNVAQKAGYDKLMVIGGAQIYALFEPMAQQLYLTEIHDRPAGDTFFKLARPDDWQETGRVTPTPLENDSSSYSFVTLERKLDKSG